VCDACHEVYLPGTASEAQK
jgi:hypothetical protein